MMILKMGCKKMYSELSFSFFYRLKRVVLGDF